ncbi:D-alanyl-D-alanine dipeptidase [Fibrobacter sp. UWH9]|uniref:M15 family metallopeptidase n=1 Tax=unclassified Fibrobacter TaxID=2634177 RepID=UPI00092334EE|nr:MULTISPECIES: M15 family metallopeptidase [unclassified Fibrobacter]OWV07779.1 peptidase M15 [Fibrobacter sp. UWH3]SHH02401.1 D-alanyl-D-alanine dipeptidase [Fibrobacter sp. UWH9]
MALANPTDVAFVPPKPEKPLRFCSAVKQWIAFAEQDSSLVEITRMKGLRMDLRYATFDNVTGHDLYCGVQRAFVRKEAYEKLKKTIRVMEQEFPGAKLVIFDAARPVYAQAALRNTVRGTPYSHYVSSPAKGGLHNFGLALDLSLTDAEGNLLDMGTDFDSFERCAGSVGESEALQSGRLTQQQIDNRNKLRSIMKKAGWVPLGSEWWHFNAFTRDYTYENFEKFGI